MSDTITTATPHGFEPGMYLEIQARMPSDLDLSHRVIRAFNAALLEHRRKNFKFRCIIAVSTYRQPLSLGERLIDDPLYVTEVTADTITISATPPAQGGWVTWIKSFWPFGGTP